MNELLALSLARKNEIAEIVKFYGATVKRKNVCIFMEYMAGKKKHGQLSQAFSRVPW